MHEKNNWKEQKKQKIIKNLKSPEHQEQIQQ